MESPEKYLIKNKKEFPFIVLVVIVLISGIILDHYVKHVNLDNLPAIRLADEDYRSIIAILAGSQAALIGLGVAFLSILSGIHGKTRYGISVSEFYLRIKHRFLNQRNIILIQLLLMILTAVSLFFDSINTIFCSFLSSIILLFYHVIEVYKLFQDRIIDQEILEFLNDNIFKESNELIIKYAEWFNDLSPTELQHSNSPARSLEK